MKKGFALVFVFTAFIYRITIGQTPQSPEQAAFAWPDAKEIKKPGRGCGGPRKIHCRDEQYPDKSACLGVFGGNQVDAEKMPVGAFIDRLVQDFPAERSGIAVGDVITAIDGVPVETYNQLYRTIGEYRPGDRVKVDFLRDGKLFSVRPVLAACSDKRLSKKWEDVIKPQAPVVAPPALPTVKLALPSFSAFPNPVVDVVTVRFTGEEAPAEIRLTSATGQVLFNEKLEAFDGRYEQSFDLAALPPGEVVFSVVQGGKVFSQPILVQ